MAQLVNLSQPESHPLDPHGEGRDLTPHAPHGMHERKHARMHTPMRVFVCMCAPSSTTGFHIHTEFETYILRFHAFLVCWRVLCQLHISESHLRSWNAN